MLEEINIALIGNPNVGKTSLFNALTGSRQHVGNWPGVTVEKKTGERRHKGAILKVTDLPGTYSLEARSLDEKVANNHIVNGRPDVVVQVVDSTNLERNLFLTTQLLDMGNKVVLALNMADMADARGDYLDLKAFSRGWNIPAVRISAIHRDGLEDLLDTIVSTFKDGAIPSPVVNLGSEMERKISEIEAILGSDDVSGTSPRWAAIRLLEGVEKVDEITNDAGMRSKLTVALECVDRHEVEMGLVDRRYASITSHLDNIYARGSERRSISDAIDKVVTNKYLGLPIFLTLMWGLFELTFTAAQPFVSAIEMGFEWLAGFVIENIQPDWLASMLGDGAIAGVGAVLAFLPNILVMFLLIALLEASGYLARAAFIMDRLMTKMGLHGKSFIPMLLGLGCNVPAIMATRTIDDEKSRLITILSAPYISCSARLPVYVLLAGIFFPDNAGTALFLMYLLGIVIAVVSALLLRHTVLKSEGSPFIMELPPYRRPRLKSTLLQMWDRGSMYLRKAGTFILAGALIVWLLASLPWGVDYGGEGSYVGAIGHLLEPIMAPLGLDWKAGVALVFGFIAKEIVVGSLGVLYGAAEGAGLEGAIALSMTAPSAAALMVFVLIYTPCVAALAIIRKETGSWRWTLFSVVYSLILAYVAAFIVYRVGMLIW